MLDDNNAKNPGRCLDCSIYLFLKSAELCRYLHALCIVKFQQPKTYAG